MQAMKRGEGIRWVVMGGILLAALSSVAAESADKADPWVVPPRNAAETRERLAELRKEYAPYLRSLPFKLDVRQRQSLNGEWLNKVEVEDGDDGVIPPAPEWFAEKIDEKNGGWTTVTVPHWRWSTKRDKTQSFPWYPESKIVWYRKHFSAERPMPGKRVFLCFAGVDWAAEVWLNGKRLGQHSRYWEPFRFDVTECLARENTVAVRLIDGPAFGELICQWAVLPFSPADKLPGRKQEFVMGQPDPLTFNLGQASSGGSGYGIHREVFLETTGEAYLTQLFARGYPFAKTARIAVETDAAKAVTLTLEVSVMPENFEGKPLTATRTVELVPGAGRQEFSVAVPDARAWWPREPFLYRCRVKLLDGDRAVDAKDTLFGFREAGLVSAKNPRPGMQEGQFLLNGQAVFLRGTTLASADLAWYWGEHDRLIDILLLTKVGNFNVIRNNQHIAFPEVLELYDRLGVMSQEEQGTGMQKKAHEPTMDHLAEVVAPMARVLYNHPGVIFFSFMNETHANMTKPVEAVLALDPERLIVPIAGALFALDKPEFADNLLGQFHDYAAWYGGLYKLWDTGAPRVPGRRVLDDFHNNNPRPSRNWFPVMTPNRMMICGEYGGEALDSYETMLNYPAHWGKTPALTNDVYWGFPVNAGWPLNTEFGLRGKPAGNLAERIASSQTHQADLLAEATKGFRLSRKAIVGYYQFHFMDLSPAHWPKSIVGYDLVPKKAFFEMAQINQPVVPLYRLLDKGSALEIWVSNDLTLAFPDCTVTWRIRAGERELTGSLQGAVPALDAVCLGRLGPGELPPANCDLFDLELDLRDAQGRKISSYRHEIYRNFEIMERSVKEMNLKNTRAKTWNKEKISVGKKITATSESPDSPANHAVDGDYNTSWRAASSSLPQALTVDLGEAASLCGARVMWRGERVGKVAFEFSDDGVAWRPAAEDVSEDSEQWAKPPKALRMQYFAFTAKGRYVRATLTAVPDGCPVAVQELEVYRK
ncbi:MAG: discoidin domain-containing protein [bacterium]